VPTEPAPKRKSRNGAAGTLHRTPLSRGALSLITVDDDRDPLVARRATVSLQAVSGLDAAQLASTRLCASPHPTTFVAGIPAEVVRNSPCACAGPGDLSSTTPDPGARVPHGTPAPDLAAANAAGIN
jgi:hypothetical protein